MKPPELSKPFHLKDSFSLFERASRVVPGGIYGHASPAASLPGALPYFATRAEGCHYEDVDGNRYLDFMCGFGPNLLGYQNPEVEEAATRQRREGSNFNHPTERMVELAEALTARIDFADWAVFGKNGSDLTTWALQVAREATGRPGVIKVEGAYHGVDAWCTPGHGGVIPEDRHHVHRSAWNDIESLGELMESQSGQIAALFLTPYHHPAFAPSQMPAPGFFEAVHRLCRKQGIVLVLDDVRAGFRLHSGGSHRAFGLKPDLAVYCKALGNGYPIAAAVGRDSLKQAAARVFLTGSYWNNAVPQAAALKVLEITAREPVVENLEALGEGLKHGLETAARTHGLQAQVTGPAAMPYLTFAGDPDFFLLQRFSEAAARRGVFFHPHHNWFLCTAHTEGLIDQAVAVASEAMAEVQGTSSS